MKIKGCGRGALRQRHRGLTEARRTVDVLYRAAADHAATNTESGVRVFIAAYAPRPNTPETAACRCDGSDRFDPHTRATGAAAVGDDPEVTPRSQLPTGSFLHLRDSGNLKGEVPEIGGGVWRSEEEMVPETSRELPKRVKTQRPGGTIGASRIPEAGGQAERRTSTVPTWDEDCRPREAAP
ncbi:hypothetical protein NDU88_007090 [Pleurodeles waltl]|uniref:Uncharacterized protein n=1 Tax=Pleurodeles waltl TaxID=8319 RepID=A0AAV7URY5_PLEWA|nr:hypothetical protein NDU88_007090 [Pleurodeles waltl]